jgi:hypothetical protein
MTATATTPAVAATSPITVGLPEAFDPRWNRIDGITVDGHGIITIDPAVYFFRYENPTWVLCDWETVKAELLGTMESTEQAVEQRALEFVRAHGRQTSDPALVLQTGWQVAAHLFRDEYLDEPGLDVTPLQLKALREATTIMALNKVELTGRLSNVGPCWFFPVATGVVFEFSYGEGQGLDELYHGAWFNEYRRRESVLAHAALGGRLVHGCQAASDMKGGCVLAYGTDLARFRAELEASDKEWMARVEAMRP